MVEFIGWCGTCLYLINHGYISMVSGWRKWVYYSGNLIAATALVISSLQINSTQAVMINGFWAVVSLCLLLKLPIEKLPFSRRAFYSALGLFAGAIALKSLLDGRLVLMLLGWLSAYIFCFGYLLFSAVKLKHTNYLLLNFVAAVILIPQLWFDKNFPVLMLEVVWAGISLYGVARKLNTSHLID